LYLVQIFRVSPLLALALLVSLATILWCIFLTRRQRSGLDKVLTGLLGLIAIYEALRILKDSGVVVFPEFRRLEGWVDFIIACLCLVAALILKISSIDRTSTQVRLRLVEANERTLDLPAGAIAMPELSHGALDASPLAAFAVDLNGIVTYWNLAAERLTGWKCEELAGQRLPFSGTGPIQDKRGNPIDAAVWNSLILSSTGSARGTLTLAAGRSALRAAGIEDAQPSQKTQLAVNH
jgi:PAS domain-containing protein